MPTQNRCTSWAKERLESPAAGVAVSHTEGVQAAVKVKVGQASMQGG